MNAEEQPAPKREYEFFAFLCHERGEADERWARRLERELKRRRIPVGDLPGKLDASRFLIVICSKRSAASPRVDAQARHFVETGRADNIVPFFIMPSEAGRFPLPPCLPAKMEGVDASGAFTAEQREEAFIRLLARLLRTDYDDLLREHLKAARRGLVFRLSAAVVVVVLTAFLGAWAFAAGKRAEALRLESEELVDFLTFDLMREASRWLPSEKSTAIAERVRDYYGSWEAEEPRAIFAEAVNLGQRASLETREFSRENAMELSQRALALLEGLRGREPENEAFFVKYSETLLFMGGLCEMKEDVEGAEAYYRKSLAAADVFLRFFPRSLKGMAQQADSLENLAKLAAGRKKDFREAEKFARRGDALWNRMLRRWPKETRTWFWRMRYGSFQSSLGHIALLRNDFASALDHMEKSLPIFEGFYGEDPQNFVTRLMYADDLNTAAFIAAKLEDLDAAEVFYSAGEEIWRALVAEDPQPGYLLGWSGALTTGGLLRARQGRLSEAGALLDDAEEILDGLKRFDPRNAAYEEGKAVIGEYRKIIEQSRPDR